MSFFNKLEARVKEIDSLLCVGIDPHPNDLESPTIAALEKFCLHLIQMTSGAAAAFKPNIAFFEAFGPQGIAALQKIIKAIPDDIPVILDAKRGDIASTAEAYARSAFEVLGAEAITLSPYLGHDSLEPFLKDPNHGGFLLCKTSNPGSGDLQDLKLDGDIGLTSHGEPFFLYEKVAQLAQAWNVADNLGVVVGATHPEALLRVRQQAPGLWILAPGIGTQGGEMKKALQAGLRDDGLGMLIPVSRSISRAEDPGKAAEEFRNLINEERKKLREPLDSSDKNTPDAIDSKFLEDIANGLLDAGCIKFGQFTLKSGLVSPIYIDLRQLVSVPQLLIRVAKAYRTILNHIQFDRLAGLPYAAIPIVTAISIQSGWPFIYPRKEVKTYGTKADIEGEYKPGERIAIIDDLATTGTSKFEAIEKVIGAGLLVKDVVVLIDRQSGAAEALAQAGFRLHAVITIRQLLDHYERSGIVTYDHIQAAREFLSKTT